MYAMKILAFIHAVTVIWAQPDIIGKAYKVDQIELHAHSF